MELTGKSYPMRSFIRYKAKEQLQVELDTYAPWELFDEELFQEIATTLFQPEQNQELYQGYRYRDQAAEVERRIADELVQSYKQIKAKQSDPMIQKLNALL